jgi:ferredoxin-type protein NapH
MTAKKLRTLIPLLVLVVVGLGFVLKAGIGTLSAVGWGSVSLLCPLGALGSMLAAKTLIPRAVISLVLVIIAVLLFARAFCAWVCPVPLVSKLRKAFSAKKTPHEVSAAEDGSSQTELSAEEQKALKSGCATCSSCHDTFDSRHVVLGGALLTAAIFGAPLFCLVCPIGLTFATILLVFLLFSGGDVTWSVVLVPALLLAEVVFFRKWCSHICPLSAFMSLVGKGNKTFRPTVKTETCRESTDGRQCGICHAVCEQGIDPRHPERGTSWSECTKCRACVEACPTKSITMPFLCKKKNHAEPLSGSEPVSKEE